jgi:hypothetical protein
MLFLSLSEADLVLLENLYGQELFAVLNATKNKMDKDLSEHKKKD